MKKFIFGLVALTLAVMLTLGTSALLKADDSADYYYYFLPGDMDEDGLHGIDDALDILNKSINKKEVTDIADVNRDGKCNLVDVLCALKVIIGVYEVERVIDERYLKESYLENFYANCYNDSKIINIQIICPYKRRHQYESYNNRQKSFTQGQFFTAR